MQKEKILALGLSLATIIGGSSLIYFSRSPQKKNLAQVCNLEPEDLSGFRNLENRDLDLGKSLIMKLRGIVDAHDESTISIRGEDGHNYIFYMGANLQVQYLRDAINKNPGQQIDFVGSLKMHSGKSVDQKIFEAKYGDETYVLLPRPYCNLK